ncbi:diguanylate cyclase [Nitrospira sp. CMX1]|nr:diguanylate cyclase [Nitrospira sp.]MBX3326088.1 diguanylate cyclase [Nitrospira sp.]
MQKRVNASLGELSEEFRVTSEEINRRILVVDDNVSIHQDFLKILQPERGLEGLEQARATLFGEPTSVRVSDQFVVDCADQGVVALDLIEAAGREGNPYAVAFVDMRMPSGWDGLETIERLWGADAALQVVICTAYSDQPWDEIRDRIGRTDKLLILHKPFNSVEVLQLATALCWKWDLAKKVSGRVSELRHLVDERTTELRHANRQLMEFNDALMRSVASLEAAQTEILRQNGELERLATRDSLTGCLNRRAFYARFEEAFTVGCEQGNELCCLMVDIDLFKRVNDEFGHAVGDQAIQAVADCLQSGVRLTDMVGRYGGEEFCLMFPRTTLDEATVLAERLRIRVAAEAGNRVRTVSGMTLTVSVGVSTSAFGARAPLVLVDQADRALYAAKESGRNCVMAMDVLVPGLTPSEQLDLQVRRVTPRESTPAVIR